MKLIIRLLLSPIIFIYACFLIGAMMIFPLPLFIFIHFLGLVSTPFIWLLKHGGTDVKYMECLFNPTGYLIIDNLIMILVPIWGPFAIVISYIVTGELYIH